MNPLTFPLGKSRAENAPAREAAPTNGLSILFRKELADQLNSTRFLILFGLLAVTCIASLYGALSSLSEAAESGTEYFYLTLFTASGNSIPSFATFLAFLGPLVGIVLGFDAVTRERSQGTLNRLAAQPIYRDAIINGKFLAGLVVIVLIVFSLGFLACATGILAMGVPPQAEEIARLLTFLLFTCVYIAFWMGLSIFFSVRCRHAATAALACIAIWIFLSFFMSMIASAIANSAYPLSGMEGLVNMKANYTLELGLNRISPYYLFSEAASTILDPNVRSIGIVTMSQLSGAVVGYLPFGQSLLLVWPHLVCMVALTAIFFGGSYISFMRQEIRA